jgi:hypothetical protein
MQVAKRYIYSCGKLKGSQYRWTPFGLPVHCFGRFYSLQIYEFKMKIICFVLFKFFLLVFNYW